jgi:transposase
VHIPAPAGRRGRPRRRPHALAGDKGYSYGSVRRWLRAHAIRAVIPEKSNAVARRERRGGRAPAFDRAAYRLRSAIECTVGALKEARRIATRYEKLAVHFLGVLKLGMIQQHLRLTLSNTP